MRCPIYIQTEFGLSLYKIIASQYNQFMQNGKIDEFKTILTKERLAVSRQITEFLYDPKMQKAHNMEMSDTAGWNIFKELSDKHSILKYFEERRA